jgi:osmotically inducible lipoprotein OsmB
MKSLLISICTTLLALSLVGCTTGERKDAGMVAGGVVGGVAGSELTGGSTAGTIAGAVGGAYVGRQLSH